MALSTLIFTSALFINSSCPATVFQNDSKENWTRYDYEMYAVAQKRCGEIDENTPCLKLFKKYNIQQYTAICGEEE